jgi:hypothetical protein
MTELLLAVSLTKIVGNSYWTGKEETYIVCFDAPSAFTLK